MADDCKESKHSNIYNFHTLIGVCVCDCVTKYFVKLPAKNLSRDNLDFNSSKWNLQNMIALLAEIKSPDSPFPN